MKLFLVKKGTFKFKIFVNDGEDVVIAKLERHGIPYFLMKNEPLEGKAVLQYPDKFSLHKGVDIACHSVISKLKSLVKNKLKVLDRRIDSMIEPVLDKYRTQRSIDLCQEMEQSVGKL